MGTSTTLQIQDTTVNGKKSNTRQTSKQSKAKTTTTRAKSTTAKPKKAPAAPKIDPHADEPPCAPIFAPKAPEPPRREARKSSCAEIQCPHIFQELVGRFVIWQHKLDRGKDKLTQKEIGEIALGLEGLVSSVNFFAKVYIGGKFLLVPPPRVDEFTGYVGDTILYASCRVILASIDAALKELAKLVGIANTVFPEDDVPF